MVWKSRRQRNRDRGYGLKDDEELNIMSDTKDFVDGDDENIAKVVQGLKPSRRKALKDELAKYPDPPGETELKGPYDGPDGEELRK